MLSETSTGKRWFESAVQVVIFYSIVIYYIETELSESGRIVDGTGFWLWNERILCGLFTLEYFFAGPGPSVRCTTRLACWR